MQTIAETRHFLAKAEKLLTPREYERIVFTLAVTPLLGDLIEGTGGIRKVRFAKDGRGKSGGFRVIYYFYNSEMPTILMDLFGKNEKANLTKAERNILAETVKEMKRQWRGRRK